MNSTSGQLQGQPTLGGLVGTAGSGQSRPEGHLAQVHSRLMLAIDVARKAGAELSGLNDRLIGVAPPATGAKADRPNPVSAVEVLYNDMELLEAALGIISNEAQRLQNLI